MNFGPKKAQNLVQMVPMFFSCLGFKLIVLLNTDLNFSKFRFLTFPLKNTFI